MRKINDLSAVESFGNIYITIAKYTDVGWEIDKPHMTKESAAERLQELIDKEFKEDEVGIRVIDTKKTEDLMYKDIKNKRWFDLLEEE